MKGKILALVLITTIVLSLSPMLHLTPIKIASAQTENNSLPLCALKSEEDGYIYVPIMNPSEVKVEFWYATGSLDGDLAGGASPYSNLKNWPDAKVDGKDTGDIAGVFGRGETMQNWTIDCYLDDCILDRKIDGKDLGEANGNFGHWGTYDTNMTGIYIIFQPSGTNASLDGYGMFQIPLNDVNFTVYRYGSTISTMVTLWFPRVPEAYFDWIMHFGCCIYTHDKNLTADASQGSHTVSVPNATWYQSYKYQSYVKIWDDQASEWNIINNISTTENTINVTNALANSYTTARHAEIEAPDPNFGRSPYSAWFTLDFLCKAYDYANDSELGGRCPYANQATIEAKIEEIMDWLASIQGTNSSKCYYGGFLSQPDINGSAFWTMDAARGLVSCLHAYDITGRAADKTTGLRCIDFLQTMYYANNGAFRRYINNAFTTPQYNNNSDVNDAYAEYGLYIAPGYDSSRTTQCNTLIYDTYDQYFAGMINCHEAFNDTSQAWEYGWNGTMHCVSSPDHMSFALLGIWELGLDKTSADGAFDLIYATNVTAGYPSYNSTKCWPSAFNMSSINWRGNRPICVSASEGACAGGSYLPYDMNETVSETQPFYAPVSIECTSVILNGYGGTMPYCNATKAGWMWTISHHLTAFMDWGVDIETLNGFLAYRESTEAVSGIAFFFVNY